jgi:hypothetical protein
VNSIVLLAVLGANGLVNTSFYTYHKVGAYSVSDFYLNYVLNRYDFRLALEKREGEFGFKSGTLEIDSMFGAWRLALGEKPYHVRAPASTNLNLWGLALMSRGADFFIGKIRDYSTSLPPTFKENRYTIGARLHRQLTYRIPVDFYIVRRSDSTIQNRVRNNNALGVNSQVKLGSRLSMESQLWTSLSDQGLGVSFALSGRYATQKYGGHFHLTTLSKNYVALTSIKSLHGSWFRITSYQKPLEWLGFSQDFAYASLHDTRVILNTRIARPVLPALTYSVGVSKDLINQIIETEYYYKKFNVSANYEWSKDRNAYGFKVAQYIVNCQLWSSFQRRDLDVWQFGFQFPFPRYFKFKGYINYATRPDYVSHTTGTELSARLLKDLYLHMTYEFVRHNSVSDQIVSLSFSKTLDFDQVGFSFVSGHVFMDVNSNGFFDVGDKPVSDVIVNMDGMSEVKTNKNGRYMFSFVKSGKHTLNVNLGCIPAEIGTAERSRIIDTRLLSQAQIDFPLEVLGSIGGKVYFDDNSNGQMDNGEDGVSNVVIALNGFLTTTDQDGRFRFANLASGTYTLEPKVLPPETSAARQEMLYVYIQPGSHFADYTLGIVKKQRPINKKVFD